MSTPVARGQVSFSQLRDGTDGNGVEYVYLRTNSSTPPSIANNNDYTEVVSGETVTRHYTDDDFCPMSSTGERCSDSPTGVDNTHQYEWVATREMTDVNDSGEREWKPYELTTMTLWSKYGARGTDGDGVEYVFARTQDETAPSIIDNDSYTEGGVTYSVTDDDFRPNSSVGRCTDDPSGTNPTWKYEWVMMRSKGAPDATGVRQWNPYALGPMALWSKYASDGEMASALVLEPSIVTLVYSTEVDEWFADKYSKVSLRYADAEYLPLNIKIYNEQSNLICEAEVVSDADEGGALAEDSLRINIIYEDETVDAILEPEIITYVTKWGHDQYHRPIKIRVQVEPFVALRLKTFNSGGYDDFYYNIEATYQRTINPGTWEQEVITITGSGRLTFAIDSVDTDIQDLNDRIDDIEGGSASRIEVTGTGCALTDVSKSGSVVTFTKGNPAFSDITNTPVTLSGYGITDAMRVIVLEDNGTTTAGTWLAKSNPANLITSYGDGLVVLYKITKAGAATTTLNINGLGAKTVYRNGSTKMTTQYAVGSYVLLYYASGLNSGSFVSFADYDANSYAYLRMYPTTGDVEYPLLARYNTTTGNSYYTEYGRYAVGVTLNPHEKSITASKFIVTDGTSDGFLKADGSIDSNVYALASALSDYYTKSQTNTQIGNAITALGLGSAAFKEVGSVASGNTGLVMGKDVHTAINTALSSAMKFEGSSSTAITDGGTQTPTIDGEAFTPYKGMVVLYGSKEFVWTGSVWEELGDEGSHALKTITISAGTGLTGGGDLSTNRTISLSAATIASLALADTALQSHQTIYALTIKNSAGTTQLTYTPNSASGSITLTKAMVGLGNVENTALSTWAGTNKITTLGTITTGVWHGTAIANDYLANSAITIGSKSISLGGSATLTQIGVPAWAQAASLAFGSLPSMYIAKNAVQSSSAVQNLTGLGSLLPDMNGNYDLGRGYVSESVPALYWSHLYVDEAIVEYIKGKNTDYITLETDIIPSGNKSLGWDAAPFHHVGTKSIGYNDYGDNIWKIDDSGNATFSGTLTVTGASTFNDSITIDGDIVPLVDDNYDLGSVSGGNVKAWSNVFTHNIYVDTIQGGTEIQQVDIACDLVPAADSQAGLGLVNSPFYNLYVDNTHTGTLYATNNIYLLNAQNASAAAGGAQKKIWFEGSSHSTSNPYLEVVNIGTTSAPVWALHTNVGFYSDSFITAGGIGTSGGSGGGGLIETLHRYADLGGSFSDSANDTFNAYTINKINTDLVARINALEGGSATNVSTTGSGNVITAVTKSGNTLTFTKGITALTSHQSLDGYVNEIATGTGNYITGVSKSGKKLTFTYGTLPTTIALSNVTGADDLKAIEALTGTSGLLKKTAANTWTLDTTSYATAASLGNYLPLTGGTLTGDVTMRDYIDGDTPTYNPATLHASHITSAGGFEVYQVDMTAGIQIFGDYGNNGLIFRGDGPYKQANPDTLYEIYHQGNLTKSVITNLLGSNTYAPYNAAGYLPLSGGQMTGAITFLAGNSKTVGLQLTVAGGSVTNNMDIGWDWATGAGAGVALRSSTSNSTGGPGGFDIYARKSTATTDTKHLRGTAAGALSWDGSFTATSIIKSGGTSAQFLKADGSVDSNTYLTTSSAADTYVKLNPGAAEQTISSSIGQFVKGVVNFWRSSGNHYTFIGFSNGATETYLGGIGFKSQSDKNLYRYDGTNVYKIFDESNISLASIVGSSAIGESNRPVYYNGSALAQVSSVGEAFLSWGGRNHSGTFGPLDAAMVGELGACRTMFVNSSAVEIEYSRDAGETWEDYGATDSQKTGLFSGSRTSFTIGKNTTKGSGGSNYMLRVTLRTGGANIYTTLNKFIIYLSTSGSTGCYCTIRARTQTNYEGDVDTWRVFADTVSVGGWAGYNVFNTGALTTYGNTKSSQFGEIQFIFGCTSEGSGNYLGLNVMSIYCFGGTGWTTPSNMARSGHIYSWDASQNTTFPADVKVTNRITLNCSSSGANDSTKGITFLSGSTGKGQVGMSTWGLFGVYTAGAISLRPGCWPYSASATGNLTLDSAMATLNGPLSVDGSLRVLSSDGDTLAKFLVYPTNPYGIVISSQPSGTMNIQSRRETSEQYFGLALNPLGGNVGIGTNTPTSRLDVNGSVNVAGDLTLANSSHIDIGPLRIEYDATNKALHITKKSSTDTNTYGLYSDGFITAGGVNANA